MFSQETGCKKIGGLSRSLNGTQEILSEHATDRQQDGKIRCDVCTALLGCGELRITTDGKIVSCIDGENDEIDEITALQAGRVSELRILNRFVRMVGSERLKPASLTNDSPK